MPGIRLRLPPGLGWAFWLALLLTGLVELALHSEAVMFRYRAVFAQGRAYDKLFEVERRPPQILFIGNSRTDNGIDPRAVERVWPGHVLRGFNLGLPGANAIVYHGEIRRLEERGLLGKAAIQTVVLGLDESALQEDNSLGYVSFLADRCALWDAARYRDWLGSHLRLWSYSGNLRQLREPDKALRFVEASVRSLDPVGGSSGLFGLSSGFRRGPECGSGGAAGTCGLASPVPAVERFLWQAIDLLQSRGVRVFVTLPPLRDRLSAFVDPRPEAASYRALLARLRQRGVIVLPTPTGFGPDDFVNAGHLNDRGAQRYSAELGHQLAAWKDR